LTSGVQLESESGAAVKRWISPLSRPTAMTCILREASSEQLAATRGRETEEMSDAPFVLVEARCDRSSRLVELERRGTRPARALLSPDPDL